MSTARRSTKRSTKGTRDARTGRIPHSEQIDRLIGLIPDPASGKWAHKTYLAQEMAWQVSTIGSAVDAIRERTELPGVLLSDTQGHYWFSLDFDEIQAYDNGRSRTVLTTLRRQRNGWAIYGQHYPGNRDVRQIIKDYDRLIEDLQEMHVSAA